LPKKYFQIFSGRLEKEDVSTSNSRSNDKNRHCQSDKIRRSDCSMTGELDPDRSWHFQHDRTGKLNEAPWESIAE
jgi:hypothetical protein